MCSVANTFQNKSSACWIPHLVPAFQWPLPPLQHVALTDARKCHVLRFVTSCLHLHGQLVHHLPVLDVLLTQRTSG